MSRRVSVQDGTGVIADEPGFGILVANGTTTPASGAVGYAPGCLFLNNGSTPGLLVNQGTATSATFVSDSGFGPATVVIHADGTADVYEASANTNAAAGTAVMAAVAAATSGDTIYVYRNATITASIAKNGVNWYIAPGVTITSTAAFVFDDAGTAMSYTVGGDGILSATGGLNNQKGVVTINNASSSVAIFCRSILGISSGGGTGNGVWCHAGTLTIFASEKISADQYTIYWTDGSCTINAGLVECVAGGAGTISTVTVNGAVGDLYVTCDEINSAGYAINSIGAGSPTGSRGRCWVTAGQIRANPGAVTLPAIGVSNALLLYVTCQKLTITADRGNAAAIQADSAASLWFTAQKFTPHTDTGGTSSPINVTGAGASSMWASIQMFDDSAGACSTVSAAIVDTSTCNLYYTGQTMFLANAADGIKVTGGAATVIGVNITTHSGNKDLIQTGGTLTANLGVNYDTTKTSGTISGPGGISATPCGMINTNGEPAVVSTDGVELTPAAGTTAYIGEIFIPCNMTITGVRHFNGSAVTGNITVALYNADGTAIAGALSAATAGSGTDAYQSIPFAAAYRAAGPKKYLLAFLYSSTSARPNTHHIGTAFSLSQATVTMGTTAISPLPSAFTADNFPIAGLY